MFQPPPPLDSKTCTLWPGGQAWFQLYVSQCAEAGLELADRAQTAGYEVLVLTVDVPQVANRIRDAKNGFQIPFHFGPRQLLDFACHPQWSLATLLNGSPRAMNFGAGGFARHTARGGVDWRFLTQLCELWRGTLIVKGVLAVEDAQRIKASGVDGIYVSNHGGRQLDSAPPSIRALPLIRAAVGANFPLIFDSGIRNGEAIIKALARSVRTL